MAAHKDWSDPHKGVRNSEEAFCDNGSVICEDSHFDVVEGCLRGFQEAWNRHFAKFELIGRSESCTSEKLVEELHRQVQVIDSVAIWPLRVQERTFFSANCFLILRLNMKIMALSLQIIFNIRFPVILIFVHILQNLNKNWLFLGIFFAYKRVADGVIGFYFRLKTLYHHQIDYFTNVHQTCHIVFLDEV